MPFIEDSVEPGSVVHTDGWLGYQPLEGRDYRHKIIFLKGKSKTASELMPRAHLARCRADRRRRPGHVEHEKKTFFS
ncbi:MAG: hypothetical protein ACRD3D_13950 [Terriglobia bacterium]